jgi:hypothetical protein
VQAVQCAGCHPAPCLDGLFCDNSHSAVQRRDPPGVHAQFFLTHVIAQSEGRVVLVVIMVYESIYSLFEQIRFYLFVLFGPLHPLV